MLAYHARVPGFDPHTYKKRIKILEEKITLKAEHKEADAREISSTQVLTEPPRTRRQRPKSHRIIPRPSNAEKFVLRGLKTYLGSESPILSIFFLLNRNVSYAHLTNVLWKHFCFTSPQMERNFAPNGLYPESTHHTHALDNLDDEILDFLS